MGDRTYITFTVNGHIPTVEALDQLSHALASGDLYAEGDRYPHQAGEAPLQSFADAILHEPLADFVVFVNSEAYTIVADDADALELKRPNVGRKELEK